MPTQRWEVSDSSLGDFEQTEPSFWGEEEAGIRGFEVLSFRRLVDLIDGLAPHLIESFICMRSWWEKHEGLRETHVRSVFVAPV